jgi:putative DNA primase/helicase
MNAMLKEASPETARAGAARLFKKAIAAGFVVKGLHRYATADGIELFRVVRLKHPSWVDVDDTARAQLKEDHQCDGKGKIVRAMHREGGSYIAKQPQRLTVGWPQYVPPYPLVETGPVVYVEGEACADALARRGITARTSVGGAERANDTDWTTAPMLPALIWPDNDKAGIKYADNATAKLRVVGCTVELIDVKPLGLPDKGDAVDWLAMHPDATAADVLALVRVPAGTVARVPDTMPRVILTRGSDVQPVAVDWLWNGWLAAGKLHLIGGAPGTGKTTIAATLAATVTCGGRWPDGLHAERGSVVFWSGEDDNADTLNPRLRAAGADMSRVFIVDGVREGGDRYPFDPARDMDALHATLTSLPDLRLIVIDPVVSAVSGDSHKNAEVRRGLQPLVDLAGRRRCALLGVTHFSKGTSGRDPVERITGSLAFAALARMVMVTAKQEADGERAERRVMLRAKSNIGPDGGGFVYDLHQGELSGYPGIEVSSVRWGERIDGTARELLAEAEQRDDDHDAASDAVRFLHVVLEMGARSVRDLKTEAAAAGIAWRTLERAKRRAGVEARKNGMNGGWEWYKAAKIAKDREDRQPERVAAFGGLRDDVSDFGSDEGEERERITI